MLTPRGAAGRFFNSEKIVPSPWSAGPQRRAAPTGCQESPLAAAGAGPLLRHCAVQTELTLPARLPPELERALAPYLRGGASSSGAVSTAGRLFTPSRDTLRVFNSKWSMVCATVKDSSNQV